MRKALIAVAVATALFAVGAFAASFAVQSEDVASGGNAVAACVEEVDIDFGNPVSPSTTGATGGGWTVPTATAKFLSAAAAGSNPCNGFQARLALGLGSTAANAVTSVYPSTTTYVTVANGEAVFDLGASGIDVELIQRASVVVDGKTFNVFP
ncbi:MAG: hypothetical protein ACRDYW_05255 [Acidimicrobiales bacterium]